jgi:methionyl aminopeptidase
MAITIKTQQEIEQLREGGRRLAEILEKVAQKVAPGVSTYELDQYARSLIEAYGDTASFLNYQPDGAEYPYPAALCTSVNNEVVHGIPKKNCVLKEGDIISIDLGIRHNGLFTDHARTIPVGKVSKEVSELLSVAETALLEGVAAVRPGARVGDIGYAISSYIKKFGDGVSKYGIVDVLSGHGVGYEVHEEPFIPNFGRKGTGALLKPGMVLAIEPMVNLGTKNVVLLNDGYTYKTEDGSKSAHFEHTIVVTDNGAEIITIAS